MQGVDDSDFARRVAAIRAFNRFYTARIGVLHEGLLHSQFTLTEARVLFELANRAQPSAAELARDLGLDPGYLSRILRAFEGRGLLLREPSPSDGRQWLLSLTPEGEAAFRPLDDRSRLEIGQLIATLGPAELDRLLEAMHSIEALLGNRPPRADAYLLRSLRSGDLGWIVHRQSILYAKEYGWDATFDGMLAEIAGAFVNNFNAERERCWVAERAGEVVGSVFLVRASDQVAKLRLLYVEPKTRGLGIGRRLVEECIGFARTAGYRRLTLWTNDVLTAARHIYRTTGFQLTHSEPHRSFGRDLVAETWDLDL